ncbi:hypothetical protein FGIG_06135 [Fasciola gigantica]|uniref:RRM domain-containing protein n=1 Tax=Fasciola gigantica TaxID=46835 RepID=A0A504Y2K6_FASGI|nr:hypothetical protein FGIG_06135 [Fasciola gigantica]
MGNKKKKSIVDSKATLRKKDTSLKKLKKDKKNKKKHHAKKKLIAGLKGEIKRKREKTKENQLRKKKKIKLLKAEKVNEQTNSKPSNFGAVSSDSEPEPIEADWQLNDADDKLDLWQDGSTDSSRISEPNSDKVAHEMSTDLEESETDRDEVLDEVELNSLVVRNRKHGRNSSKEEISLDAESATAVLLGTTTEQQKVAVSGSKKKDKISNKPSKQSPVAVQNSSRKKTKKLKSKAESAPSNPTTERVNSSSSLSCLSMNDTMGLVREIRHRATDLASRSLYISPVPPDCSLERLRQLSPDVVSCRLSYNPIKKNCRRYAFLEYRDNAAALAAQKSISGRLFAGQNVSAQPVRVQLIPESTEGLDQVDRQQLFITGLHPTVTRADLRRVFPKAELDYPFHSAGFSLGYAIAKFVNESVAFESFVKSHQIPIRGCTIFINYVIRPPKLNRIINPVVQLSESKPAETELIISDQTASKEQKKSVSFCSHTVAAPDTDNNTRPIQSTAVRTTTTHDIPAALTKKSKVLIETIKDPGYSDEEENPADGTEYDTADMISMFTESDSLDGTFLRKRKDPLQNTSNILTSLFHSRKQSKTDSLSKGKNTESSQKFDSSESHNDKEEYVQSSGNDDSNEDDHTGDGYGASDSDHYDENDEDRDEDEDSVSVVEDGESAETNDSDDEDDNEEEEEADDASADDQSSDASEELNSREETSVLFKRPLTASERASMRAKVESSDEEIDKTLRTVIQSRRTAMRALKTAGSKRPWLSASPGSQKRQKSGFIKSVKPFELPVPTKRRKKA